MRPLFSILAERVLKDGRVALVTIASTEGSTPREAGARMVVTRAGDILGTIGGGTLEYRLIAESVAAMQKPDWRAAFQDVPLGPDLGQCCGGHLTYVIEIFSVSDLAHLHDFASRETQGAFLSEGRMGQGARLNRICLEGVTPSDPIQLDHDIIRESFVDDRLPILLFGAGHVGRALILALAPLPFCIRWIDSRDDVFPALMPQNVTAVHAANPDAEIQNAVSNAIILVMTHSHPLDLAIVSAALRRDDLPFIGLIGSATKKARFMRRLRDIGLGDAARHRLVSPIGLPAISGKEPAMIAASVTADLLIRRAALLDMTRPAGRAVSHLSSIDLEDHPHE